MYGGGCGFDQNELEWSRFNQMVLLSEDGNAVSLDTTCEYEMNWNKSCKSSPDFEVVCDRSGYVMAAKSYSHECFDMDRRKTVKPACEKDIKTLVDLFDRAGSVPNTVHRKESVSRRFFVAIFPAR